MRAATTCVCDHLYPLASCSASGKEKLLELLQKAVFSLSAQILAEAASSKKKAG